MTRSGGTSETGATPRSMWRQRRRWPRRLERGGGLGAGSTMVDLGPRGGDQLRIWVEAFGVERVTAVELDPDLAGRALERVRCGGWTPASAWWWARLPRPPGPTPADRVVALDSAYFSHPGRPSCGGVPRPASGVRTSGHRLLQGEGALARLARAVAPLFGVPVDGVLTEAATGRCSRSTASTTSWSGYGTDEVLGGLLPVDPGRGGIAGARLCGGPPARALDHRSGPGFLVSAHGSTIRRDQRPATERIGESEVSRNGSQLRVRQTGCGGSPAPSPLPLSLCLHRQNPRPTVGEWCGPCSDESRHGAVGQ